VAEIGLLREELVDRFGEIPEPLENLLLLQVARIKLGQAGATAVSFKGGRLAVTPIELDSARVKLLRAEIPEALYESGKSQLSVRVSAEAGHQFAAVVRVADALLSVTSAAGAAAAQPD
jgi:transcription-repair coupling factor (superfamily II helicase)